MDYRKLAEAIDEMREVCRAAVAGLVADGFTDEQAHEIVTHLLTMKGNTDADAD